MPSKEILSRYSCKRKRDVVTGLAILMMIFIVAAQLYLTLIVPVQLQKRSIYEFHVEKDKVIKQADTFRRNMRQFRPSGKLTRGEVDLVRNTMNQLVIYLTEHQDYMNEKQVFEVKRIFDRFNHFLYNWKAEKPKFFIREEKIDQKKLIDSIANELVAEKKN